MNVISLSALDLTIAGLLLAAVALLSMRMQLGVTRQVLTAGTRALLQLMAVGLVLRWLFDHIHPAGLAGIALLMLLMAGREVSARQKHPFRGGWSAGIGLVAMVLSSFTLAVFALTVLVGVDPWYEPRYAIPLLGMLLGNTMTGIALALNYLTGEATRQQDVIEARLILGETWFQAAAELRRESVRTGLIPILNAMAIAGVVSLPGMMTGQILAGSPPMEAVKYQVMILFLIAGGTALGTFAAVSAGTRHLFDERHRLRLDRLRGTTPDSDS